MFNQSRKRIYLFFGCVTAVGYAAGILFGGELALSPLGEAGAFGAEFSPVALALAFLRLEKYLLLIFLSGFTVFAPMFNFMLALYLGAAAGHGISLLWHSSPSIFLYIAQGAVIAAATALYVDICEKSTSHRLTLTAPVPSARAMLSRSQTRRYIVYFCGATFIMALISSALYMFTIL